MLQNVASDQSLYVCVRVHVCVCVFVVVVVVVFLYYHIYPKKLGQIGLRKQCRPRSDVTECGI